MEQKLKHITPEPPADWLARLPNDQPLCRFKMHKRKELFYGNIMSAVTDEVTGKLTYTIKYNLPGQTLTDQAYYAVINYDEVELLKTRRPGFWGWLFSKFQ